MKRSDAKIGMLVQVKGHRGSARIQHFMREIPDGVVLDKAIAGFKYWNASDIEPSKRAPGRKR
jgi:hypothetical protein